MTEEGRDLEDRLNDISDENVQEDTYKKMDPIDRAMDWCHDFVNGQSNSIVKYMLWLPLGIVYLIYAIYWFFKFLLIASWNLAISMVKATNEDRKKRKYQATKALQACVIPFAWMIGFFLPIFTTISLVMGTFIFVDQVLVYDETVSVEFTDSANNDLHNGQKVALLFRASYHQLEKNLSRFPGWTVNDPWFYIKGLWDNPVNTQRGVWLASKEMTRILSDRTTRYGTGDDQNDLTIDAAQDIAIKPDVWNMEMMPSEKYYENGIEKIRKFEKLAESDPQIVNIRADDLVAILEGIKNDVLGEAYGKLTKSSDEVKWSEIDDIVKFARGAAIVARDQLAVLRSSFTDEISRGGLDNLDVAISALDGAITFHPWWVEKGSGDSMIADHRAKISRYYSEAIRRIEDMAESLKT